MAHWTRLVAAGLLMTLAAASRTRAQAWRTDADDAAGAFIPGMVVAGATLLTGLDGYVAKKMQRTRGPFDAESRLTNISDFIGGRGPFVLAGALSVAGYVGNDRRVGLLGEQAFVSVALSYGVTLTMKGLIGRERPNSVNKTRSFRPARGFLNRDFRSFPSGHAATAFGVATVLATGVHGPSLNERRVIGGVAYALATLVGISRISLEEHWTSDVIGGAAIGIVTGTWVTHRARRDRTSAAVGGAGMPIQLMQIRF